VTGRFITFEGIDGAGKSSHIETVAEHLRTGGAEVVCTREPGGTPLAEALRALVLEREMDAQTETLLVFAARRDHLRGCIEPALARGATVLCDRFTDATFAYQGGGRGVSVALIAQLERWTQEGRTPDLTFWFDLDPSIAAARLASSRPADRFEAQDRRFFERVAAVYRARLDSDPARFARIDAAHDRDAVRAQVRAALEARGW
jgi:dTMP kinase